MSSPYIPLTNNIGFSIEHETQKAVLFNFFTPNGIKKSWIPKSQCNLKPNFVSVSAWMLNNKMNEIGFTFEQLKTYFGSTIENTYDSEYEEILQQIENPIQNTSIQLLQSNISNQKPLIKDDNDLEYYLEAGYDSV